VSQVDPASNTIVLARRADLETRRFTIAEVTFVAGGPPAAGGSGFRARAQVRHRAEAVPADVRPAGPSGPGPSSVAGSRWTVQTDLPVWAAAPGQACVLFDADDPEVVVGGGRIVRDDG
jgi:tRNA-specific 2-thiouridylase